VYVSWKCANLLRICRLAIESNRPNLLCACACARAVSLRLLACACHSEAASPGKGSCQRETHRIDGLLPRCDADRTGPSRLPQADEASGEVRPPSPLPESDSNLPSPSTPAPCTLPRSTLSAAAICKPTLPRSGARLFRMRANSDLNSAHPTAARGTPQPAERVATSFQS
jgi:hypothetical protein